MTNYKIVLEMVYDAIAEERFDKVQALLALSGVNSVEELENLTSYISSIKVKDGTLIIK